MITIGIDSGISGGLVALGPVPGTAPIGMIRMPLITFAGRNDLDVRAVKEWIISQARPGMALRIALEAPLKGRQGMSPPIRLWECYGMLRGMLLTAVFPALSIRLVRVEPGTGAHSWQRRVLGRSFKAGDSKRLAAEKAAQLWPRQSWIPPGCRTPHDGIIDAALIAHFAQSLNLDQP